MAKNKPDGKSKGKGSQLVIRIDKAERVAFVSLCEELDTSAAREIRRFMRAFVATHRQVQPEAADETKDAGSVKAEPILEKTARDVAPPLQQGSVVSTETVAGSLRDG